MSGFSGQQSGWQSCLPTSADDEERQLEEAIRLSSLGTNNASNSAKRKHDAIDLTGHDAPEESKSKKRSGVSLEPKYLHGALRITRTPGRKAPRAKNTVNLPDLIRKEHLVSACMFSFFIAESEVFPLLPLSSWNEEDSDVPVYVGRDPNMDPTANAAAGRSPSNDGKITRKLLEAIEPQLRIINKQNYGKNYNSFYAWCSGSAHTKLLVLVYPTFLRVVITSCNMMKIDTELGDNHWYIHDLLKLPEARATRQPSPGFESDLLDHLRALSTPDEFLETITGSYDFSNVQVRLVTSVPGTHCGVNAERHGLLRLRRVVRELESADWDNPTDPDTQTSAPNPITSSLSITHLETCTASIGNLTPQWLFGFRSCALGLSTLADAASTCGVPATGHKIFYPTVGDVRCADPMAQQAASNIGCHTRPWPSAPVEVKRLFHRYKSKDQGWLTHQKSIMAFDAEADPSAPPRYMYIGSANLSKSAWGALEVDKSKKANTETCGLKMTKISNFECGVVVPGYLLEELIQPGAGSWEEALVPHDRGAVRYNLAKDRPWNDPRWVKGYDESWDDKVEAYSSEPEDGMRKGDRFRPYEGSESEDGFEVDERASKRERVRDSKADVLEDAQAPGLAAWQRDGFQSDEKPSESDDAFEVDEQALKLNYVGEGKPSVLKDASVSVSAVVIGSQTQRVDSFHPYKASPDESSSDEAFESINVKRRVLKLTGRDVGKVGVLEDAPSSGLKEKEDMKDEPVPEKNGIGIFLSDDEDDDDEL